MITIMTKNKTLTIILSCLLIFFVTVPNIYGQKMLRFRGTVIDAATKEPLPFVHIVFAGKNIGTITDYNGQYSIETQWASDKIEAKFIGYQTQEKKVTSDKNQTINFELESEDVALDEVTVKAKRKRYRNKDNPAVAIIRKTIDNKKNNRKESLDSYEYNKYEKIEFDLNNITEEFQKRKAFKKFKFIFDHIDTSKVNGKPYLPMYLKETASEVYYRKSPKSQKEYVSGTKMVGFDDYIDNDGVAFFIDEIYQDIDLYQNNIPLLTNQFVSPISDIAPGIYKFRIVDTLNVNGHKCFHLAFLPRNKGDFAFIGDLYITADSTFALIKADMRVVDEINLNFVNDLHILQEFDYFNDTCWMLTKDEVIVDFNIGKKGVGMFGKKTVSYNDYKFNGKIDDSIFSPLENVIREDDHDKKTADFWNNARHSKLSSSEQSIYTMIDSIQEVPAFKRTMNVMVLLLAGYWSFGPIDVGPVNTFYSFNDVEGLRLKVGGRTNKKFSEQLRLEGYLLYGFKDKKYKYSGSATLSLNKRPINDPPENSIRAMYQVETNFPGMDMQFVNEDNFLLSFKRGVSDKILYYKLAEIEQYKDWGSGVSTGLTLKRVEQEPGGALQFNYDDSQIDNITSAEIIGRIRFAPNEKYYQGKNYRIPIISKFPILELRYAQGIKGVLDGDYNYSKLTFNLFKRFYISPLGFSNFELEAGKIFGDVPYPLLYVHRANQTYSYQLRSYNLMNFLEFVSDQYVSINLEHNFNGFFFNRIPLLKRLKFREIVTFKGVYGGVSDKNNPGKTPGLMQFPVDENGTPSTFTLQDKPYMEVSVGVGNILKVFRVDVVKRLTHLDNPNVSEIGVRARFKFDF